MSWWRLQRLTAHQSIYGSSGGVEPHPGSDLLLRDGASFFLLRDGSSTLQLGY